MTEPVNPPAVVLPAPWPALGSNNYNVEAYAAGASLPGAVQNVADQAQSAFENASISHGNAGDAQQSAIAAAAARDQALAASNFKGQWADLSGPLARPASVKHSGRFWLLLQDLANVAASEPTDASAAWTAMDSSTSITQRLTVADAVVDGAIGVKYLIAAPRVKLVLPTAGLFKGAYSGFRLVVPLEGQTVDFGPKFRGQAAGERKLKKGFGLDVNWEDETDGWV